MQYLVVSLGDAKEATPTINKTLNPEWNTTLEMPVVGEQNLLLEATCWDKDRFGKDYMGEFDVILEDVFSEEPLTPGVRDNDTRWAQAVEWTIYATILAEAYGVTQANVGEMATGDDAAIVQFLGGENADGVVLDTGLGLDPTFAMNIVEQVGNYGESYDRNLGDGSPLKIPRSLNALWTKAGILYAPPLR